MCPYFPLASLALSCRMPYLRNKESFHIYSCIIPIYYILSRSNGDPCSLQEIDFEYFKTMVWPFVRPNTSSLNPAVVWREIQTLASSRRVMPVCQGSKKPLTSLIEL